MQHTLAIFSYRLDERWDLRPIGSTLSSSNQAILRTRFPEIQLDESADKNLVHNRLVTRLAKLRLRHPKGELTNFKLCVFNATGVGGKLLGFQAPLSKSGAYKVPPATYCCIERLLILASARDLTGQFFILCHTPHLTHLFRGVSVSGMYLDYEASAELSPI